LQQQFKVSERRACKVIELNRTALRYQPKRDNTETKGLVCQLSEQYPRYGYRKIWHLLKRRGVGINKETVRAIRKSAGLQVPRKQRRRRALGKGQELRKAEYANHVWSWDFMFDATSSGRKLKLLNIIDEYTRECLVSYAARTITARDVFRQLQMCFAERGLPTYIRSDNGPEFVAHYIRDNLATFKVKAMYIEPGSPWQNPYIESFNSILRDNILNRYLFNTPREAQINLDQFKAEYNSIRPHGSLDGEAPALFYEKISEKKKCA
jgi:transposase InsO family protein